jgi:hypothetical protein
LQEIVTNPLLVLRQATERNLYLSEKGAVVLSKEGKIITTYSSASFDQNIKGILDRIHKGRDE